MGRTKTKFRPNKPRSPASKQQLSPLSTDSGGNTVVGNRARTMSYARSSPRRAELFSLLGVLVIVLIHVVPAHFSSSSTTKSTPKKGESLPQKDTPITTIAYAISLIQCGDGKQNAAGGLAEAALVLRHAIHHISSRNPSSGSRYDYKLYALVHRQAEACAQPLEAAGYTLRMVDPPVTTQEIRGEHLRQTIHREVCCGVDEFIKLHAFALPEPISVHVDMDFIFLKPLDVLLDAILDNNQRENLQGLVETFHLDPAIPNQIDAFITRDWFSTLPGRHSPYQAGFIVARRNPALVETLAAIVKEGNYTAGNGRDNGWGGLGYGGFIGAKAMQGLLAYYYDQVAPGTHVELDSCLFNHMGTHLNTPRRGCKIGRDDVPCPNCQTTPLDQLYSIHYTVCRKPWNCVAQAVPGGRTPGAKFGNALDTRVVHPEHCLKAVQIWHNHRADLERRLQQQQSASSFKVSDSGEYKREYFQGHCAEEKKYLPMQLLIQDKEVYETIYQSYDEPPLFYIPKEPQ